MSLINKMLQDLDRRQALGAGASAAVMRPPASSAGSREWFWRIVTALLLVGVAWVVWVSYQLLPRPLLKKEAFVAAPEQVEQASPAPESPPPVAVQAAPPAPVEPVVAPAPPAPPLTDALKLALQIETPIREPAPRPAPVQAEPAKPRSPPAKIAAAAPEPPASRGVVDKRDREISTRDVAHSHFRRALLLLSHGRVSEGEAELAAALRVDPAHAAARQAYVALLLEQQRVDPARRLLEQAIAIDASQANFVLTLARLHAQRKDYAAALAVLDGAGQNASHADFQALKAAVLQRMARHSEAVQAYHNALRGDPQQATSWVGLGISLEVLGRRAEASIAYRNALAAGPLAAEAREYAEARARALD